MSSKGNEKRNGSDKIKNEVKISLKRQFSQEKLDVVESGRAKSSLYIRLQNSRKKESCFQG